MAIKISNLFSVLLFAALASASDHAVSTADEVLPSTPVGSWQVREEIMTDAKGQQTLLRVKTALLDAVAHQGTPHYWIETAMESYQLKKGQRKAAGQPMVMKVLVDASVMSKEPQNVIGNLQRYGREIILQQGNQDPMRITEGGTFAEFIMKSMGVKVEYDYQPNGVKTVEVPAGKFECTNLKGSGTAEVRAVIQTIRVQSEMEACVSDQVPFGIVYYQSTSTTNGKASTSEGKLTEFGESGAVSQITKTPMDAPQMPKLF